ncbi:hypothetical protein FHT70_000112 [Rhizobium sp. BK049]|nr:hypothetical protein [Rhizobium sp. BK049]
MTAGRIEAGAELAALENGSDLDRQLREAGIGGSSESADDILAQLMAPKHSAEPVLLPRRPATRTDNIRSRGPVGGFIPEDGGRTRKVTTLSQERPDL